MNTSHQDSIAPVLNRREMLFAAAGLAAAFVAPRRAFAADPFSLPQLPYADNALDPVISSNTLGFHYGKHHKTYVDNLNKAVAGTPYAEMSLKDIITGTHGQQDKT